MNALLLLFFYWISRSWISVILGAVLFFFLLKSFFAEVFEEIVKLFS